jgi:ERCC4-related helicase
LHYHCTIGSGKSTTVINVIQQLVKKESNSRALIMVESKEKVLAMLTLLKKFGKHTDLTVYGVHEKEIWNMIKIIFQEELMFGRNPLN